MPTNRAGDKTATQAPSAKPEPEGTITQALPADGDPPNASTYAQAYKVVADFIDFLLKPQAKLNDWAKWIMAWRSGGGHKRFLVDHFGLPMGRIQSWREDWSAGVDLAVNNGSTPVDMSGGPATYRCVEQAFQLAAVAGSSLDDAGNAADFAAAKPFLINAGAALEAMFPLMARISGASSWRGLVLDSGAGISAITFHGVVAAHTNRHAIVVLEAADTAGDFARLYRRATAAYDNELTPALEWEAQLAAANTVKHTVSMGWCLENAASCGAGTLADDFCTFQLAPGGGNWFFHVRGGGVTGAVDTGVAASTNWVRFRVEFHGQTVADNATRAVRAYINGALVATITTNLPSTSAKVAPHFEVMNTLAGSGAPAGILRLGPVTYGANLHGSDVT